MSTRHSFTLLEMLAAVAILALVGAIGATALTTVVRSWEKARRVGARLEKYQTLDRFAESVLRNTVPFRWRPDDDSASEETLLFKADGEELRGACLRRVYGKTDYPFRFYRLYCEDEKLKCDWSMTPLRPDLEPGTGQRVETEILAEGVKSLDFLFADYENGEITWTDSWDEDRDAIPLAIQFQLTFTDGERQQWLRRTSGSAAGSVWGNRSDPENTESGR